MAGVLYDIFSKNKEEKKQEIKPKIIIDYREKNSLVPSQLIKENFEIEFKELKIGDYIVKETVIERKTIQDFISSMINRRLIKQLEDLQQYDKKFLIIEGLEEKELYGDSQGVSSNAIRGFLLSIILKYKIPLIYSKNPRDTAKFLSVLANKKQKETPLNAKKKTFNKKEQLQFIIESFPGIGPKNAKKLLKEFKSIKNISSASKQELEKTLGKKGEIIYNLINEIY